MFFLSAFWHGLPVIPGFFQGALGGGGFVVNIGISPDGNTRFVTSDEGGSTGLWIWDSVASKWAAPITASSMPSGWGCYSCGGNVLAFNFAPNNSSRCYMLYNGNKNAGYHTVPGGFWRTDNCGPSPTWYQPETVPTQIALQIGGFEKFSGPQLAVDPQNPDVVYFGDNAGLVYSSANGGTTLAPVTGLYPGLINLTTSSGTLTSSKVLNFAGTVPASITAPPSNPQFGATAVYCDDTTALTSLGQSYSPGLVTASTASTITVQQNVAGAIGSGDTIVCGSKVSIVFDQTSGTTGGKTNGIYVGWTYNGGGKIWFSTDAGATW